MNQMNMNRHIGPMTTSTTSTASTSGLADTATLQAVDLAMVYAISQPYVPSSAQTTGSRRRTQRRNAPPEHTTALSHVNVTLGQGQTLAIMGPSGSGKSTLLHVLAGIQRPTSGRVFFRGAEITAMSDAEVTRMRRSVFGFVFQSGQLLPELSALENVALPLMLSGTGYAAATARAAEWMRRMSLLDLADHRPGEMSGGQMQRVAIARALCINPAVIFADEPTGALARRTGRDIMALFMEVAGAHGSSVIGVTHDPDVAHWCGRIVTMQDGRLSPAQDVGESRRPAAPGRLDSDAQLAGDSR